MNRPKFPLWTLIALLVLLLPAALPAQTDCEEGDGPLNRNPPQGIAPAEIIQKFATKEAVFKQARDNYAYTQDVTVQTLDGHTVDGEYKEVTDITYDNKGNRIENVTFAPQSTLSRVSMSREDFADIRSKMPFVMTSADLPEYDTLYVGTQHVDEIDTYVFDVAPKHIEKDKRYFQGRIWVDNHDLQIVKTCGKSVPDTRKKDNENLMPRFVTYREQIDGEYWFPTYTRADDFLHFSGGDVHIREIIKYTNYKRFGSRTKIIFKGEAPPDNNAPPNNNKDKSPPK
ncbi:MAG TPA: hypothetical protein VKY85_21040 [Candidatus Angelobacter sp.]|nr:hypothetical protein [Candidatus Angelobacter sp.]